MAVSGVNGFCANRSCVKKHTCDLFKTSKKKFQPGAWFPSLTMLQWLLLSECSLHLCFEVVLLVAVVDDCGMCEAAHLGPLPSLPLPTFLLTLM